ncbi:MAG: 3-oxoacyl-[acyl-carrier-protein] synthase-1 [Saprospiraceae bacterium]|jgi:3-oxoacyl-[acyl-carrier-protein] synthase-1
MKRVVITGLGIVSSLGNNKKEVRDSLHAGKSGIAAAPEYAELGMRSHVDGKMKIDASEHIDRKIYRFMGDAAAFTYIAMQEAIEDAGLEASMVESERTGLVLGTGGASPENLVKAADTLREKGIRRVGPYMVTKTMASTVPACISTPFKIKGVSYSISSACSTSAHCIGHGAELIQLGKQDVVFAGGGEEVHWSMSVLFDGMGALSSKYNDNPTSASRPYDVDRDGFVISGGGSVLVLESLEHAQARGAKIYGELVGYGATSDGYDMVQPSGEGAARCMRMAMQDLDQPIDYLNAHGTSTPVGDTKELQAVKAVFTDTSPVITSTKSLSGHALGAAGSNEAIYSLIMMESGFIAGSANIQNLDPDAQGFNIAKERIDDVTINTVMSNSFGFGGTNCSLIFQRFSD